MLSHVTLERDETGWFVAQCPALPGCVSQGKDEKEAIENIQGAVRAWLWAVDQNALRSRLARRGRSSARQGFPSMSP